MLAYVMTDNGDREKTLVPLIRYLVSSGLNFQKLVFKKFLKMDSGSWKENSLGSLMSTRLCNEGKTLVEMFNTDGRL